MNKSTYSTIIESVNKLSEHICLITEGKKRVQFTKGEKQLINAIAEKCKTTTIYKNQTQERQRQREFVRINPLYKDAEAVFLDIVKKILDCSGELERYEVVCLWFPILNDVIQEKIQLGGIAQ